MPYKNKRDLYEAQKRYRDRKNQELTLLRKDREFIDSLEQVHKLIVEANSLVEIETGLTKMLTEATNNLKNLMDQVKRRSDSSEMHPTLISLTRAVENGQKLVKFIMSYCKIIDLTRKEEGLKQNV